MAINSNSVFTSGFQGWATAINGLNDVTKECDPRKGYCDYYNTCPFADENIDGPQWFLEDEWTDEGGYSATLFLEGGRDSGTIQSSDSFILYSGSTYRITAKMWKETNYTDAMYAGIYTSGGTLVAKTDIWTATHSQQASGRTWTTKTKDFTVNYTAQYNIMGYASTVRNPTTDIGTPCFDDGHASFDEISVIHISG